MTEQEKTKMPGRAIKFRAWNPDEQRYENAYHIENGYACHPDTGKEKYDWILEQFTGLHDKNGREIYEGDIVTASWHWAKPHVIELPSDYYDFYEYAIEGEMILMGNIHENPELLK